MGNPKKKKPLNERGKKNAKCKIKASLSKTSCTPAWDLCLYIYIYIYIYILMIIPLYLITNQHESQKTLW